MKKHTLLLLVSALLPVGSHAGTPVLTGKAYDALIKPDTLITYATKKNLKTKKNMNLKLHVHFPPDHASSDKRAAIVNFFGGGWSGGTVELMMPQVDSIAKLGMVGIAAYYRTRSRESVDPRACVEDAKSAIRFVRQHAAELGIDPDRIAASGGSAGGHLAAATASLTMYDLATEDTSISSRPNALVLFNPVYDNGPGGYGNGTPKGDTRVKNYWKSFSPKHNIGDDYPPQIVFLGSEDHLIPETTAIAYDSTLKSKNIESHLHIFEGVGHGFFNYGKNNGSEYAPNHFYDTTMALATAFLRDLGYFDPPATLTLTAPNGGEKLIAGSFHNITWTSEGNVQKVSLAFSTGGAWTTIVEQTANDGTYIWAVPDSISSSVKLRITDSTGRVTDESDNVFAITANSAIGNRQAFESHFSFSVAGRKIVYAGASPSGEVKIFDLRGRTVRSIPVTGNPLSWDGTRQDGSRVPAGFLILQIGDHFSRFFHGGR